MLGERQVGRWAGGRGDIQTERQMARERDRWTGTERERDK